jgi:hypothetical protein
MLVPGACAGTGAIVCGGPFIHGVTNASPISSLGSAACALGDLWLTQTPAPGLLTGYYCTTAGPGGTTVWTQN